MPIITGIYEVSYIWGSVAYPDPGPLPFVPLGQGLKKSGSGIRMKISYYFWERSNTFTGKTLKILMRIRIFSTLDPGWKTP